MVWVRDIPLVCANDVVVDISYARDQEAHFQPCVFD